MSKIIYGKSLSYHGEQNVGLSRHLKGASDFETLIFQEYFERKYWVKNFIQFIHIFDIRFAKIS